MSHWGAEPHFKTATNSHKELNHTIDGAQVMEFLQNCDQELSAPNLYRTSNAKIIIKKNYKKKYIIWQLKLGRISPLPIQFVWITAKAKIHNLKL